MKRITAVFLVATCLTAALGTRLITAQTSPIVSIEVSPDRKVVGDELGRSLIEPHLAIDPANPNHWLVGTMAASPDLKVLDCMSFVSFDGGASWSSFDFHATFCADPWVGFAADGSALYSQITGDNSEVRVYRSEDGGKSWPGFASLGYAHDHETFVVGPPEGGKRSVIYVTSMQIAKEGVTAKSRFSVPLSASTDGGRTFETKSRLFPSNLLLNAMNPVVLSDGTVMVSFTDFARPAAGNSTGSLQCGRAWVATSSNGGTTLSVPKLVTEACVKEGDWAWVAVSPVGEFKDRVYWLTDPGRDRLLLQYSDDKGETWSTPVATNSAGGPDAQVRSPVMAVNGGGVLAVAWRDTRGDRALFKNFLRCEEIYFTASKDGGRSFAPEVKVSTVKSCPLMPAAWDVSLRYPAGGDYMGIAPSPDGRVHVLWSDNRHGVYELWTATVTLK